MRNIYIVARVNDKQTLEFCTKKGQFTDTENKAHHFKTFGEAMNMAYNLNNNLLQYCEQRYKAKALIRQVI